MALDKLTQITTSGINSTTPLSGINVTGIITASSLSVSGITTGAAATFDSVDVLGVLTYDDVTNVDALGIVTARSGVRVTGGSVGIGTESPHAKLEVSGGQNQTANQFTDLVSIAANANNDALDAEVQLNFGISPSHTAEANRKARIQSVTHVGNATPLLINPAGGGVAIGTDTPYVNNSFTSLSIGGSGKYGLIELNKSDGVAGSWIDAYGTNGDGNLRFTTAGTSGAITFWTGGSFTEKVRITSDGKVGIGTQIPGGKFQVGSNGSSNVIITENIGVDINDGTLNLYQATSNVNAAPFILSSDVGGTEVEKVRITAAGNIGIGTDNLSTKLDVRPTAEDPTTGSPAAGSFLQVRADTATVGEGPSLTLMNLSGVKETGWRLSALTASGNNGDFTIHGYGGGATYSEYVRITSAGHVTKPYQPSFLAYNFTTRGQGTNLIAASTYHNTGNHYSTTTGIFTAPIAGKYLFSFALLHDSAATTYARVLFRYNGNYTTQYADTLINELASYTPTSATVVFNMSANDTMQLFNEGNAVYDAQYGSFSGHFLG